MKRLKFLLFFCSYIFCSVAQNPIQILEAENAELTLPVKVKYVNGFSGNAYVGDNDPGSEIVFRNVNVPEEGTYEFRTYYASMHIRSIAVQSGYYPPVILTMTETTEDWNRPPVGMMLSYIYLDKGNNTIKITPYNGGGPNIDKFEIWETGVHMSKPEIKKSAFTYDLTDDAKITINGKDVTKSSLNDNDEFTIYENNEPSSDVYIECPEPCLITGYLFSEGPDVSQNTKNWELEYSTDGIDYYALSPTQTNILSTAVLFTINRQPHADSGKAAKYYKVKTQGRNIGEIQLFGIPYLASDKPKNFPADITDGVDLTTKAFGTPLGAFSIADERFYNLFDRNMEKKYYSDESLTCNVEIELEKSYRLDYYTLTSCQDYPERDPRTWVVEGFDRDWEVISEVQGFEFPCRYATMKFPANNRKIYKGFRLRTSENNGGNAFQLLKWQLFGGDTPSGIQNYENTPVKIYSSNREIVIRSEKTGAYQISNLTGQTIHNGTIMNDTNHIPVSPGIYIVSIKIEKDNIVRKIIIE